MSTGQKISVYLVDDHQIILDGIRQFILHCDDMHFVGAQTNGDAALADIIRIKPDVAMIDFKMPGKDGLQLTRSIASTLNCKVIILSMYGEQRYINDAKRFGASGYLLKNVNRLELIEAIRKVHRGETVYHKQPALPQQDLLFTRREKDIVRLLVEGRQTAEISTLLHLSPMTVSTHRKNIMRKTEAGNVAGLIHFIKDQQISLD